MSGMVDEDEVEEDEHSPGRCVIGSRSYWAPDRGGYVYDVTHRPGTSGQQVMDADGDGSTLYWSPSQRHPTLASLMRSERRRALARA